MRSREINKLKKMELRLLQVNTNRISDARINKTFNRMQNIDHKLKKLGKP